MKQRKRRPFDPEVFVNTVNGGRTLATYKKNQIIFSQGDPADAIFYIHEGKVKVTVISDRGKEAVVAIHGKA
ncbi:MAG: Crp/Fnr family transcriptional regulator [Sphingobacteriales bacterium]|jgi:CRP-like cAMP-binding protein